MKKEFKRILTAALSAAALASTLGLSTTASANSLAIALQDQMWQSIRSDPDSEQLIRWQLAGFPEIHPVHPTNSVEIAIEDQRWQSERAVEISTDVLLNAWNDAPNNPANLPKTDSAVTASVSDAPIYKAPASAVDLSAESAFPKIQDQGIIGSCTAFSTIYYQFTYHVNKRNGISSESLDNCYSPAWFYYLNENEKVKADGNLKFNGTGAKNAYNFTIEHGAVKWYDQVISISLFDRSHPEPSKEAMLAALSTRIKAVTTVKLPYRGNGMPKNVIGSSGLNSIKRLLSNGYVLHVSSRAPALQKHDRVNSDGQYYIPRMYSDPDMEDDGGTHSYCIVGYDDNFWGDINRNGKKDAGETGAFKIANSWGTAWHNEGFSWVMYDALNEISFVDGNWEDNETGTRYPAFMTDFSDKKYCNYFDYITVGNYKNYFVAQTSYTEVDRRYESNHIAVLTNFNLTERTSQMGIAYQGSKSFDAFMPYASLASDVEVFTGTGSVFEVFRTSGVSESNFSAQLVDNKGNKIADMKQSGSIHLTPSVQLTLGDVNYDTRVNAKDIILVQKYMLDKNMPSDLQFYLADYNEDGAVNARDIIAIQQAMLN